MSTEQQLERIRRQTQRYCYEDGFVEMALGGIFIVTSLGLALLASLEGTAVWIAGLVWLLLVFGVGYLVSQTVQSLKERITYLRTGYVAYNESQKGGLWLEIGAALGLIVLAALFSDLLEDNPSVFYGLILAISVGIIGYQIGLWRMYIGAVVAIGMGILLAIGDASAVISSMAPFAAGGLTLVITGLLALRNYLQANPQEASSDVG